MSARAIGMVAAVFAYAVVVRAADQIWNDAGTDNIWSTNALNWDAGVEWMNGNSAVFSGGGGTVAGETVDVSNAVVVAGMTFQTNGYVIADADANGTLTLTGAPEIKVVNAGDTGTVSEVIAGVAGFTKTGNGVLNLTAANAYTGMTTVSAGMLRLNPSTLYALGVTGTGNDTIVASGATLDLNGCYAASRSYENFSVSGSGVDGKGVLVNNGANHNNNSVGNLTLLGDSLISSNKRIDANTISGNGYTLTKIGVEQFCVQILDNAKLIINQGTYTLLADGRAMGGTTPGDTVMNAGTLNAWNTMTVPERITFNGGAIQQGNPNRQLLTLTGYLTLSNNVTVSSGSITTGVDIAGYVDGPGGFTMDQGWIYVTGNTNTYSGRTYINGGRFVHVGKTNLYSGLLGVGTVTNYGTLYGYSPRISGGSIVNYGALYCNTGVLCVGNMVNNGSLYIDRGGSFVCSNAFFGFGTTYLRYGGEMIVSGSVSSNALFKIVNGSLTLTNNADFRVYQEMQVADKITNNVGLAVEPTNVTAVVNVPAGCTLAAQAITFGNGLMGNATGILNQAGGLVLTTGKSAEDNGIRLGHYPAAYSVYNMMGGTLIVGKDYDLCCATDGKGWFNMTGGEVFATRVMLNERTGGGGNGRLTVAGGVLNVGTLNAAVASISNGITVDAGGPYLVEYGGAGGVVRAVTNFTSDLNATLYGTNANAITFDTSACAIGLSGNLTGAGGLNKSGVGTLTLTGANTYAGGTAVLEGTLLVNARSAVPDGALKFGVSTNGTCGVLHATGALSLDGLSVGVVNPEQLDEHVNYTVITCDGTLSGTLDESFLTPPWRARYDRGNGIVKLHAVIGTVFWLR